MFGSGARGVYGSVSRKKRQVEKKRMFSERAVALGSARGGGAVARETRKAR